MTTRTKALTARDRRKAARLDAEIKAWATALRRSQRSIRASIAAGRLVYRRGVLRIRSGRIAQS